jgi:hypothetical protein
MDTEWRNQILHPITSVKSCPVVGNEIRTRDLLSGKLKKRSAVKWNLLSPMTIWIWKCHTRRSTKRKLTFLQLNRLAKRLDSKEEVAKRNSLPSRINSSTTQMKTKLSKKLSLKETPESVECEPLPRNVNKPENFFSRLGRRFSLYYEFRGEHIIKK